MDRQYGIYRYAYSWFDELFKLAGEYAESEGTTILGFFLDERI